MDHMHDQAVARNGSPAGDHRLNQGTGDCSTPLDTFFARAAQRRAEQDANPDRLGGPWVDPDPKAITALPAKRHPVTIFMRELAQTPAGIAKRKTTLKHIVAQLTDKERKEVTWDDVMAFPWHHVSADKAEDYYLAIHQRYTNGHTRKMYITYLRSVLTRCQRAKLLSLESLAEIFEELPVKTVKARAKHARRLRPEEIAAIIDSCAQGSDFMSARDAAMIALFATTGMRVSELTKLELDDWDQVNQELTLRQTKNGRDRVVPVDTRVAKYLGAWQAVRGTDPGPLFIRSEGRKGHFPNLSTHAIRERLKMLTDRADVGTVCTHDFRRTVATTLLRSHDALLTARLLGHTSLAATMTYDLSGIDEQRSAINSLPLPDLEEPDDLEDAA